jgi:hypothetical protein
VVLAAAAGVLLAWEALALVMSLVREQGLAKAVAVSAGALIAGPLMALVLGFYAAMMLATGERFAARRLLGVAFRGSGILGLAVLTWLWPLKGAILAIATYGVLWAVRSYGRTTSPIKRRTKLWLLGFRIATLVLLALWVLNPFLEYSKEKWVRGLLLIAVDTSSSMRLYDMPPKYTDRSLPKNANPIRRIDAVRSALADQEKAMTDIAERCDLLRFCFSSAPDALGSPFDARGRYKFDVPDAEGAQTAIGDSLDKVVAPYLNAKERGQPIVGVVLISDGCNNTSADKSPERVAEDLGDANVPIYAVGVGSEEGSGLTRAMTVRDLDAPKDVQRYNRFAISAFVDVRGLQGKQVRVTARFGDANRVDIGSETFEITGPRQTIPVRFVHVPVETGSQRVIVEANCLEPAADLIGESVASRLVRVVDNELRLLYIEGKFRYECRHVTEALQSAEQIKVDRLILLQPLRAGEGSSLGDDPNEWLRYHAILFGDVPPSRLGDAKIEIVKDLVDKYGKGFCMMGGAESFGMPPSGGGRSWADGNLALIMPVNLRECTTQIEGDVKVALTGEGKKSPVMQIAPEGQAVEAAWMKLPALTGANRLAGVKPAATVLAEGPGKDPLVVAQPYGKGRVLAVAFDTTFRWVLNVEDTAESQRRFWRQVALYLADPKGNVWIQTDSPIYYLGRSARRAEMHVAAGVEDARGRVIRDANAQVTLTPEGGPSETLSLDARAGLWDANVPVPSAKGRYKVQIVTKIDGKDMTAEQSFEVKESALDMQDLDAKPGTLRAMAGRSRGQYVPLAEIGKLMDDLSNKAGLRMVPETVHEDLMRNFYWPMLALLVLLLCLEWSVRKRKGLV